MLLTLESGFNGWKWLWTWPILKCFIYSSCLFSKPTWQLWVYLIAFLSWEAFITICKANSSHPKPRIIQKASPRTSLPFSPEMNTNCKPRIRNWKSPIYNGIGERKGLISLTDKEPKITFQRWCYFHWGSVILSTK